MVLAVASSGRPSRVVAVAVAVAVAARARGRRKAFRHDDAWPAEVIEALDLKEQSPVWVRFGSGRMRV